MTGLSQMVIFERGPELRSWFGTFDAAPVKVDKQPGLSWFETGVFESGRGIP